MNSRRWIVLAAPVIGLACLIVLGSTAMQAQVATQPKAGDKARPAERAAPAAERTAPADADRTDPNAKGAAPRRAPADDARAPAEREGAGRDAARSSRGRNGREGGGWLGVYVADVDEKNPVTGVKITQVFPASPAARAGFRSGDVITQVNEQKVADPQAFVDVIESMPAGFKANFAVQRNNQMVSLAATLGQNYWISQDQGQYGEGYQGGRSGRQEEEFPIHALELEHHRRSAEQHQRMEQMLVELKEEIQQLREELKNRK